MDNKKRFILVFIGTATLLFGLFYFYPAQVFEGKVVGESGELIMDLSLRTLLFGDELPSNLNSENIISIGPTLSGWLILFVIIIGLPFMLAYRSTVKRPEKAAVIEREEE